MQPATEADPSTSGLFKLDRHWSDAEMSGLRRMIGQLQAADVPAHLRCGRSDVGAPWALVCDSRSGRVLLHVTIGPGHYQLVAWNLSAPVRSPDLAAILLFAAENGPLAAKVSDRVTWQAPASLSSIPAGRFSTIQR